MFSTCLFGSNCFGVTKDGMLGSTAPETDLLSQIEAKMQAEVTAYLERMQQVRYRLKT